MRFAHRIKLVFVSIFVIVFGWIFFTDWTSLAQQKQPDRPSSFMPVIEEPFDVVRARDKANKSRVAAEHQRLLDQRYDLARRVDDNVRMTRGKPIPVGPTARLKRGVITSRRTLNRV